MKMKATLAHAVGAQNVKGTLTRGLRRRCGARGWGRGRSSVLDALHVRVQRLLVDLTLIQAGWGWRPVAALLCLRRGPFWPVRRNWILKKDKENQILT